MVKSFVQWLGMYEGNRNTLTLLELQRIISLSKSYSFFLLLSDSLTQNQLVKNVDFFK